MKTMNNRKNEKETLVSKYGLLFLIVLAVFSILFCFMLCLANREFYRSQENIKQTYVNHIQKADSLYFDMVSYNKNYISIFSDFDVLCLLDSIVSHPINSNKRNTQTGTKHHTLLTNRLEAVQQLHKEYDDKIMHDSLLLVVEKQLLEGQTNSMLNAHLNKIEHEYSNITLWAAVLTILFLVFSFYSIFKMDELVQQGTAGLRDIRRLKEKGDEDVKSIIEKGEEAIRNNETKISSFIDDKQRQITGMIEGVNQTKSTIEKKYDVEITTKIAQVNSLLNQIKQYAEEKGIEFQELDGKENGNGQ